MSKTVAISEDIHTSVVKKKTDMFEKYGVTVRIADLVDLAIELGIDSAADAFIPQGKKLQIIEKEDMIT